MYNFLLYPNEEAGGLAHLSAELEDVKTILERNVKAFLYDEIQDLST